ncbi:tyrosine-type recombinase/integrase [Paraprevotella clara]|uniref:tyrosine-type recombinase/integrase n=1 Tax=Paraprevotella clara TaxID=454154 RepID=UPI003AB7DFE8
MDTYQNKPRIKLSRTVRYGRRFIEVSFDDDTLRLPLSEEEGVQLRGGKAYLPAESFVLSEFFDRYVELAFIDYSAIRETVQKKDGKGRLPLPHGYAETLRQMRYSPHTVRAYTSYFGEFQQYFTGRNLRYVRPKEINDYMVHLIDTRKISSCQQNLRINAIKFYYEKVLGMGRQCYNLKRAKREKTLPDVLSKDEIRALLAVAETDIRMFCMFSLLYSAGLRISELISLRPDDINVSRMLIRVRQGKGRKDRYTLLSKPLIARLSHYRREYKPREWLFERHKGEPFTESIVSKKLKEAAKEAGITKRVYPHLLRHSFATHLIEQGTDLKIIKELLGHNQLKTTEMYVHIADTFKSTIRTPLDDILEINNETVKQEDSSGIR